MSAVVNKFTAGVVIAKCGTRNCDRRQLRTDVRHGTARVYYVVTNRDHRGKFIQPVYAAAVNNGQKYRIISDWLPSLQALGGWCDRKLHHQPMAAPVVIKRAA